MDEPLVLTVNPLVGGRQHVSSVSGPSLSVTTVFLISSVTVNFYVFFVLLLTVILLRRLKGRGINEGVKNENSFKTIVEAYPCTLPFIITDQFMTLVVLGGSMYALIGTSLLRHPFKIDDLSTSESNFVLAVLSINTGRYVFKLGYRIFPTASRDECDSLFWTDILHHAVMTSCFLVILIHREIFLLGVIAILMDSDMIFFETTKIGKTVGFHKGQFSYFALTLLGLFVGVLTRGALPLGLLISAIIHQNPLIVSPISVAAFFLSVIFFSIINIWLIRSSFISFEKSRFARLTTGRQGNEKNAGPAQQNPVYFDPERIDSLSYDNQGFNAKEKFLNYSVKSASSEMMHFPAAKNTVISSQLEEAQFARIKEITETSAKVHSGCKHVNSKKSIDKFRKGKKGEKSVKFIKNTLVPIPEDDESQ